MDFKRRIYQNVPGSEILLLKMQIPKLQLFRIESMFKYLKGMRRCQKKVTVSIPLQTPSTTENTLCYGIDPNREASP